MEDPSKAGQSLARELADRLEASEARLRSIIDRSPDAYLVVDSSGTVRFVNPAAVRLFGVDETRLIGQPFGFPLTAGETTDIDVVNQRAGGLVAEMRVVETDWEGSKAYVAVLRDITERKAAEAKIRQLNADLEKRVQERTAELERSREALLASNGELERFAHAAAHDLQAPLRSILGFAQLLQGELGGRGDARIDEWLNYVVSSTKRLQTLVRDLLSYTRLDAQTRPLEAVDMGRIFREVVDSLSALIEGRNAQLSCGALPTVVADPTLMSQLLQNLIENGIKYNPSQPPRVEVNARRDEGAREWEFIVSDDGQGIDPRSHQRIFEVFQRLHSHSQVPGTGIGLAICHRIVQRHGGRIWVESEPGNGSAFHFTLPDREAGGA